MVKDLITKSTFRKKGKKKGREPSGNHSSGIGRQCQGGSRDGMVKSEALNSKPEKKNHPIQMCRKEKILKCA